MTFIYEIERIPRRRTRRPKENFLRQSFWKISCYIETDMWSELLQRRLVDGNKKTILIIYGNTPGPIQHACWRRLASPLTEPFVLSIVEICRFGSQPMTSSVYVYVTSSLLGLLLLTLFLDNIRPTSAPPAEQTQNYSYWQVIIIKVYHHHNIGLLCLRAYFTITFYCILLAACSEDDRCVPIATKRSYFCLGLFFFWVCLSVCLQNNSWNFCKW